MWQLFLIVAASHLLSGAKPLSAHPASTLQFAALRVKRSRLPRRLVMCAAALLLLIPGMTLTAAIYRSAEIAPFMDRVSSAIQTAAQHFSVDFAAAPLGAGAPGWRPARRAALEPAVPVLVDGITLSAPVPRNTIVETTGPAPDPAIAPIAANVKFVETRYGRVEIRALPDGGQRWTYPPGGKFDAVIVGASGGETIPGAEGLLSHGPVQTVFLPLGDDREWVIQYRLADKDLFPARNGMVVTLPMPAKVEPPWIRTAELPPPSGQDGEPGALLSAVMDATGKLSRIHPVPGKASAAYAARLLPALAQWEFQPARRAGAAVELEVLLLAPPPGAADPRFGLVRNLEPYVLATMLNPRF